MRRVLRTTSILLLAEVEIVSECVFVLAKSSRTVDRPPMKIDDSADAPCDAMLVAFTKAQDPDATAL